MTLKLIIRPRQGPDRIVPLGPRTLRIGRGSDQDLSIPDRKISSAHAVLEWHGSGFVIRDLGSTNGTFVNGLQVAEKTLETDDEILVGNTTLVLTEKDSLGDDFEAVPPPGEYRPDSEGPDVLTSTDMTEEQGPQTVKFRLTDVERDLLTGSGVMRSGNPGAVAQKRLSVLYALTDAIRGVTAVDVLLERVMDFIFQVVDADRGVILLPEGDDFVAKVTRRRSGAQGEPPGMRATVSTGLVRQAVEAGEAVITRDAQQDDRFAGHQSIYLYGIRSAITVPLLARERVLGVLHLDKRDARRPFDEEDLHILVIVCTQTSSALANAALFQQITQTNQKLEAAKEEIERWNRELERKVEERTLEIQRQAERIAELGRQKDELLGMVAHDLRTPLTGLLGFAEMALTGLSRGAEPKAIEDDLEVIRTTALEMNELLSDLLDVSKIEAGKLEIAARPVDILELIEEARARYTLWTQSKQLEFRLTVPKDLPAVSADPRRILQVLNNLVSNAVKFSRPGDAVTLGATSNENTIVVSVTDTGQGISQEDLAKLFAPFEQGSSKATRGERGTGLGLAIARKIVELHGGQIWAVSQKGLGSQFAFTLPIGKA
ncbi:FHA domain-containing protein [bacterium]|nr:FHA domain-containing protein [bacterium]